MVEGYSQRVYFYGLDRFFLWGYRDIQFLLAYLCRFGMKERKLLKTVRVMTNNVVVRHVSFRIKLRQIYGYARISSDCGALSVLGVFVCLL